MQRTKTIAACGMAAALSVVIMVLGAVLGLGMYASPMIAGLCLLPIGRQYGRKHQWILWLAVSLLCLILIADPEQNLMYITLFGLYPILWPMFQKLSPTVRRLAKFAFFNGTVLAVEALVMLLLVPESMGAWLAAALLILGNITFVLYDFLIPRVEIIMQRYLKGLRHH